MYWHAFLTNPQFAGTALAGQIEDIVGGGGMVVAPYSDDLAEFEWFLTDGQIPEHLEDDLHLIDEVIACALEQERIDPRRIHMAGLSAGAMNTAQMSFRRSRYVASIAIYSGGMTDRVPDPGNDEPSNKFSALIFHGGADDVLLDIPTSTGVYDFDFVTSSGEYRDRLDENGHYWIECNHGLGHSLPPEEAPAAVWRFLQDHPFGTEPSPYVAGGLPAEMPDYCTGK